MSGLLAAVRAHCAEIAASARWVTIDPAALGALDVAAPPPLDPDLAFLDGPPEGVARGLLILDAINFGSGWFPTLDKDPGSSGTVTLSRRLTRFVSERGAPWTAAELAALRPADVASVLGQDPGHELMALYARALHDLAGWLGGGDALAAVALPGAEALAEALTTMPFFDDRGFYKRAQITPSDLALAGVAAYPDLDELTVFADNLVPHVLRVEGVLRYDPALAARIDAGELLAPGSREEEEIRGCAVHACEELSRRLGVPPRILDSSLWHRGQAPRYKRRPRHRTRTVFY